MARAVKKISIQKGHDIKKYALVSFGGAGGQHATGVADALGIETILIHPLAGVLSALGIGQTGLLKVEEKTVEKELAEAGLKKAEQESERLQVEVKASLEVQGAKPDNISFKASLRLKYQGSDTALPVTLGNLKELKNAFETDHQTLFGFYEPEKPILIEAVQVTGKTPGLTLNQTGKEEASKTRALPLGVYDRGGMAPGQPVKGPAIIIEDHGTNVVPVGWQARKTPQGNLVLTRHQKMKRGKVSLKGPDPIMLEIFNNRFMTIAEEMGAILEKTAHSVNIKERLDFSCAIFDSEGDLVANAPHIPVHLGSMGEAVKTVAVRNRGTIRPGDALILNDPYHGGTHLPDITIVVPVFLGSKKAPDFFVASRGHHADIGGITPGSMPPNSKTIEEEGVLFDNEVLLKEGVFQEETILALLNGHKYPSRNPDQNIADIKAQVAACQRGIISLKTMCREFGFDVVSKYMAFIQENAEAAVKSVIEVLKPGQISYPLDNGLEVKVKIIPDPETRTVIIDFTGTSPQHGGTFNAPKAVTVAAVLYVFRCLVGQEIPLNTGCLKPLTLIVPKGSFLNPKSPAAVVAGNVETSQAVTNALLLALGKLAAAQGTMNNLTFGNDKYQYYETIAGGYGAGEGFNGVSARQVHMTNSRLTDPEVLEWRYPVLVEEFSIRQGSGGKGKWVGGNGTIRKIKVFEDMEVSILSSHREIPPPGLQGGGPGKTGKNSIDHGNRTSNFLKGCDHAKIKPGDVIHIETPGGGGFGKDQK
ncbi:MAG: hydantoinase B/oxoprolinase family protein, partial [Alphaproteobacteria bacterium]